MANLQLELRLDTFPPVDSSVNEHSINHQGNTTNDSLIDDNRFNKVYPFDGNLTAVEIPFKEELHINAFTFSLWVKADYEKGESMIVIENGQPNLNPFTGYRLFINEEGHWAFNYGTLIQIIKPRSNPFIPDPPVFVPTHRTVIGPKVKTNHWTHIAVTHSNQDDLIFHVDGIGNEGRQPIKAEFREREGGTGALGGIVLGKERNGDNHFKGQMAFFRMFDAALTPQELKFWMNKDVGITNTFKSSLAIDFNILNKDAQKVLAITDDFSANDLEVEILNTTSKIITVQDTEEQSVSRGNAHFALSFRPGVLSVQDRDMEKISLKETEANKGWKISTEKMENGVVAVYLLKTTEGKQEIIAANSNLSLKLKGFVADNHYGSRGTQVMLTYQKLLHADAPNPISGTQVAHLNIVSHLGRENIPLHIGFIGSNTIINDGNTANELKLRLTNVSQDYTIKGRSHLGSTDKNPLITLDFNSLDDTPDSVLTDQFSGMAIEAQHSGGGQGQPLTPEGGQASSGVWSYAFEENLAPKEFIDLTISGLKSDKPNGIAHLYVKHEDIPGYFDGQTIVSIEKGPLVFRDGNIGIGTDTPTSGKLVIKTTGGHTGLDLASSNSYAELRVIRNTKNTPDNHLYLNHGSSGNVFIGTSIGGKAPRAKLHVEGSLSVQNGNVGIGTVEPQHALTIKETANAISNDGKKVITSNLGLLLQKGSDTNGEAIGLGFQSSSNADLIGAAIIHKRETSGSRGSLHFATKSENTENFDIPIRMTIDRNGNVGIGTTTPTSAKLVIKTPNGGTGLDLASSNSIAELRVIRNTKNTPDNHLYLNHGSSGNVFIGTSTEGKTPRTKLHVEGSLSVQNGNVGIGTATPSKKLEIDAGGGGNIGLLVNGRIQSKGAGGLWVDGENKKFVGDAGSGKIGFFNVGWKLVVTEDGNVGIGTDTPTSGKLVIKTPGGHTGIDLSSSDSYAELRVIRNTKSTFDNHIYLGHGSSGNVCIGTATRPKAKLHVNGITIMNSGTASHSRSKSSLADQPIGSCLFDGVFSDKFHFYYKDNHGRVRVVELVGRFP